MAASSASEAELVEEWVASAPAPALRSIVDRYIGYRLIGFPAGLHRGLPSRRMTFIVSIDNPIDVVAQSDRAQSPQGYRCVIGGLHSTPALIAHDGNPLGFRALFGMPASELCELSVELADVVGATGRELWERLQRQVGWSDRFAACDDVLSHLATTHLVAPELQRCWDALVRSGGRISMRDLAVETGYSRQHVGRRFRAEFGLSPKTAARVVRFERARHMLAAVPPFVSIGQVAASCGYYDQAHLYRDFARLAGCTPTEFLREDAPFFQDSELVGDPH